MGEMAEYTHSAQAVFELKYHLICCTKYRYKILRGRVAERVRDLIRQKQDGAEPVVTPEQAQGREITRRTREMVEAAEAWMRDTRW